jgi:hypothetical protein
VCVVETDCEVDFAAPLDYVEPDYNSKGGGLGGGGGGGCNDDDDNDEEKRRWRRGEFYGRG